MTSSSLVPVRIRNLLKKKLESKMVIYVHESHMLKRIRRFYDTHLR
jgi:hypothetical protein